MQRKHYLTLVLDHAPVGERHVAFEIGGGICGSGFPEYDFYHEDEIEGALSENGTIKSPMRQKIIAQLASKVKKLFIVNGHMGLLLENLGKDFIAKFSNIEYFSSFYQFCEFAKNNPSELEEAIMVIDKISMDISLNEDDYATILRQKNIHIPVVNAGAYKLYDDKALFPLLYGDNAKRLLPDTWFIDKNNYKDKLHTIMRSPAEKFILKLPASSHARDTVIIDRTELARFIQALMTNKKEELKYCKLAATDPKCLAYFLENLCKHYASMVVRELVQPDPIQLGAESYRCAARSVLLVCYDTIAKQFDFIEHVSSYWQRARNPYCVTSEVTHDNLISADIKSLQSYTVTGKSALFINRDQHTEMKNEYKVNPNWTKEQTKKYFPKVLEIVQQIVPVIAECDSAAWLSRLLEHKDPAVTRYVPTRMCFKPMDCMDKLLVKRFCELSPDVYLFITIQLKAALLGLQYHRDCSILPAALFQAFDFYVAKDPKKLFEAYYETFLVMIMSLDVETRAKLKETTANYSMFFPKVVLIAEQAASKGLVEANNYHVLALAAYKKMDYQTALLNWKHAFDSLASAAPLSADTVSTHSNLASCYRELGEYAKAEQEYVKAITICKRTNLVAEREKLAMKMEKLGMLQSQQTSPSRQNFQLTR